MNNYYETDDRPRKSGFSTVPMDDSVISSVPVSTRHVGNHAVFGTSIERYSTTPEVVEAALVTESNLDELAKWCGGQRSEVQSHDEGVVPVLLVPSVFAGPLTARVGYYVVKDTDTGRFKVMSNSEFESRKYHKVGVRQDGLRRPIGDHPPYTVNRGVLDMS